MARKAVERNIAYDDQKKKYYVNLDYGKDENGIRNKKTETFATLPEARKRLKLFEADKIKGNIVHPKKDTIEQYTEYWLEMKSLTRKPTTIYGYKNIIMNHINPYLGKIELQKLTIKDLTKYFIHLKDEKKLDPNTIRKHQDLLKAILNTAVDEEKIFKNLMLKMDMFELKTKDREVYNSEQLKELFEKLEGHGLELPVKLASYLGLRRGEANGLKWKNVNFQNRTVAIKEVRTQAGKEEYSMDTKTKTSNRMLAIPDDLFELLVKTKEKQRRNKELLGNEYYDEDYVFCKENGTLYRANYCSNEFKKFLDKNELPHIRFHDLRHSFASIASEKGVSLYDVSKMLGHSSIGITAEIYTHQFDKSNRSGIEAVANTLK